MHLHFPNQKRVTLVCNWMETAKQSPSMSSSTIGTAPIFSKDQTSQISELVNQSLTISCSVVGTVTSLSIVRTGRPVPELIVLGGWYSPHLVDWANWSTSPRAHRAQWSVQSPVCRLGELVHQSPSVSRSVVGTVPSLSIGQTSRPVPERILFVWPKIVLILWKNCITILMCDVTEHPAILSVCCLKRGAC